MSMNYKRAYDRIMANYATGIRGDLDIADFQKLDKVSAHLLVEFEPKVGRPSGDDIERYFAKTFEGKIKPIMSTASIKPACISVIAQLNMPVRDIEDSTDKSKMTAVVAGMMYMDNQLKDVWEVKDIDGKKVLAKEGAENIDQIIATRRNRMFVTKSATVSLASVASVRELLPMGAKVKAWHQGQIKTLELVKRVQAGFQVKNEAGAEFVIAKEGILDLKEMADAGPNEDAALMKYYSEAYGDKGYASKLVKAK